jgi:FG-GAP repeat
LLEVSGASRSTWEAAGDFSGFSVAGAGDVNGDGIPDLLVGATQVMINGAFTGRSYVVFGVPTHPR